MSAASPAARPGWPGLWVERLRRRLEGLEGPLVRLWGWPGSGVRLLLRELAAEGAEELPPATLADGPELARAAREAQARGARWLLCRRPPPSPRALAAALDHLPLGLPLVLACRRRPDPPQPWALEGDLVAPHELLLAVAEVAALWRAVAGETLDPATAEAWREAADGWYLPLRLAAEAAAGATGESPAEDAPHRDPEEGASGWSPPARPAAESLLALPGVRFFLQGIVDRGSAELRQALVAASSADLPPAGDPRRDALDAAGWLLDARLGEPPRPPRLLAGFCSPPAAARRRPVAVAPPAVVFRVRLFGEPRARRAGPGGAGEADEHEVAWPLARTLRLLAFLASAPERRASKEELVDALFPERDPELIRKNFHPTLSHLRRCLGGGRGSALSPVLFRGGGYELNPDYEWSIDLARFEAHLEAAASRRAAADLEAAARHLHAAWRLYRGPYLQGLYDAWAVARREALHRRQLELLRALGEIHRELGDLDRALDAYRALLAEDPLEERVQTEVMEIYAERGRRDLVRRQYDRLSALLLDELGVEPLPETTAIYHRLMA